MPPAPAITETDPPAPSESPEEPARTITFPAVEDPESPEEIETTPLANALLGEPSIADPDEPA
jgi:hypothetical protein